MNISIRLEVSQDYRETEVMVREAFWDVYRPGCVEHLMLHKMRHVPVFVNELNLVACDGNRIVGQIASTRARVISGSRESEVLCVGPLSVLPSHQRRGIGSMLMNQSIAKARSMGFSGAILFGNPHYYHRFGFVNAEKYGIHTPQGDSPEFFMARELREHGLNGVEGDFVEDPVFTYSPEELELFEKEFPFREKHVMATQIK